MQFRENELQSLRCGVCHVDVVDACPGGSLGYLLLVGVG